MNYRSDWPRNPLTDEYRDFGNGWLLLILAYLFGGELIQKSLLTLVRSRINIPYRLDAIAIYGLIAYAVLMCFRDMMEEFPLKEIIPFLILGISFLVSWLTQPSYEDMFQAMLPDFLMGIVGYAFFRCVHDWKVLLNCLSKLAVVMTISLAVYLKTVGGIERYSMYLGYLVLGGVVTSANELIRRGSILHAANTAFGLVLLLSMGARGPVACMLIFMVVRIAFDIRHNRRSIFAILVIVIATIIIFQNFDTVVDILITIFDRAHLSIRALQKLQRAEFLSQGTRPQIRFYAIEAIRAHLFTGVGIGKDRIYIAERCFDTLNAIGYYPHNPFIEIWLQFGIMLGPAFILLILRTIFNGLFSNGRSREARDVVLIMLFVGFVPLMVSDSYFTKPAFFWAMAACRAAVTEAREEIE